MKPNRTFRIFLSHDYPEVGKARKIRTLLQQRLDNVEVSLSEDLPATKRRDQLKTVDVVAPLLTSHSIKSTEILQEVGAAWALEKEILPIVSPRNVLNYFSIALRPEKVLDLDLMDTPEGRERLVAAFKNAIALTHAGR